MYGSDKPNPRLHIEDTCLVRTLRFMEVLDENEFDDGVRDVLLMLGDCLPSGTKKDGLGASMKQLVYIARLARLDVEQVEEFSEVIDRVGGLGSQEASHLIDKLKSRKKGRSSR